MRYFETRFLEEAKEYLASLDMKTVRKVLFNVDLSEQTNDPRLFKKLQQDIWEFRTLYQGTQIRFLAFWDKTDSKTTLVIATHGFHKKTDKVPSGEINRALRLREQYFKNKF
ncbi:MAG: type II toxin-antitoxin system RelE/ParE family toxin [Bacteroidota bacterium]